LDSGISYVQLYYSKKIPFKLESAHKKQILDAGIARIQRKNLPGGKFTSG